MENRSPIHTLSLSGSPEPTISAIIITLSATGRNKRVRWLIESLQQQTHPPVEIITVTDVKPAGRARNTGAKPARGKYLLFLDDDAEFTSTMVLSHMIGAIQAYPKAGIVGSATLPPPTLTWFERRYFKEFPRSKFRPSEKLVESDMATTLCCLIKRSLFEEMGGFHELLVASEDPEFRDRVRHWGFKTLVVRDAQVIHPPPSSFKALWKRSLWYGRGEAMAYKLFKQEHWRESRYRRPPWWAGLRILFWWVEYVVNVDKLMQGRWPIEIQLLRPVAALGHGFGYLQSYFTFRVKEHASPRKSN